MTNTYRAQRAKALAALVRFTHVMQEDSDFDDVVTADIFEALKNFMIDSSDATLSYARALLLTKFHNSDSSLALVMQNNVAMFDDEDCKTLLNFFNLHNEQAIEETRHDIDAHMQHTRYARVIRDVVRIEFNVSDVERCSHILSAFRRIYEDARALTIHTNNDDYTAVSFTFDLHNETYMYVDKTSDDDDCFVFHLMRV